MIPKIIHYFWFGGNQKPEIVLRCIRSWKKFMPDWEIKEWNETNYDVQKSAYMRQAYAQKMWAFVSDYARFDILYQYGGIYLDTDVEMLKSMPEEILNKDAFTGMESTGYVGPGLIFGCPPFYWITKKMLEYYKRIKFDGNSSKNPTTVNELITSVLILEGFVISNIYQDINGLAIYPSCYFSGYDLDVHEKAITRETILSHHYAGSWVKKGIKSYIKIMVKKIFGIKIYRKIIMCKRRILDHW